MLVSTGAGAAMPEGMEAENGTIILKGSVLKFSVLRLAIVR
jgi:hypothetical protein